MAKITLRQVHDWITNANSNPNDPKGDDLDQIEFLDGGTNPALERLANEVLEHITNFNRKFHDEFDGGYCG